MIDQKILTTDEVKNLQNEVNQEKQKVSENILDKIKNYFSGVTNNVLHPGQQAAPSTSNKQCFPAQPFQAKP